MFAHNMKIIFCDIKLSNGSFQFMLKQNSILLMDSKQLPAIAADLVWIFCAVNRN